MKHVFIVNPAAGKFDRTESYQNMVREAFAPRGVEYEILVSQAPGECRRLAHEIAASGEEARIYACGGDGTLNEVVNGIFPAAPVTTPSRYSAILRRLRILTGCSMRTRRASISSAATIHIR